MRTFRDLVLDVVNETVDLFQFPVDVTVKGDTTLIEGTDEPFSLVVVASSDAFGACHKQGAHALYDEGFDEYRLADLIVDAHSQGFSHVYIHQQKAA